MESTDSRLREEPLVWSLATAYLGKLCSYCMKAAEENKNLLRCSQCKQMHYCNQTCQKSDWTDHKFECKRYMALAKTSAPEWVLKRCPDFPSDGIRVLARVVLKVKREGEADMKQQNRYYKDLTSHEANIMQNDRSRKIYSDVCELYAHFIGVGLEELNKDKLLRHYGKLVINQFAIKDGSLQSVGVGLYLSLSRLEHSCDPTGRIVFDGKKVFVIPVTQNKFPNEALENWDSIIDYVNHSYIDNLVKKKDRNDTLRRLYHFDCECSGCTNTERNQCMESFQCQETDGCPGRVVLSSEGAVCLTCRALATEEDYNQATNIASIATQALHKLKAAGSIIDSEKKFEVCSKSSAMQEGCLHSLNIDRMQTLRNTFETAVILNKWQDAVQYGNNVMQVYRFYLGEWDPWRASFAVNLSVAYINCGLKKEAKQLLFEAINIQKLAFGNESSPVQYIQMLIGKCD